MEPMCHQHSNKEADEHCISFRQKPVPTTNTHLIRHTNTHTTQTNINIPSASPLSRDTAAAIVEVVEEGLVMWEGLSKMTYFDNEGRTRSLS